jgi:hypothetical protein
MQKKSDTEMIVSMPAHMSIEIALAEHAAVIRALGKRVVGDVIEMGRRLTDAKKIAGYGGWLPWLDREFGWSDDTARKLMQVSELAESRNLRDLSLPISGLYLLAAQVAVLDPAAAVAALGAAPPAMDLATRHSRTAAQPLAE